MNWKALLIDPKDNVVIALDRLHPGDDALYRDFSGNTAYVKVLDEIPVYHKIALKDFNDGDTILKYGECIGTAYGPIKTGALVHVQNVRDIRGTLMMRDENGLLKREETE